MTIILHPSPIVVRGFSPVQEHERHDPQGSHYRDQLRAKVAGWH